MTAHRTAMLIAILVPGFITQGARADDDSGAAADLKQVVVTATRTAQPLDATGSSMTVISAADLDLRQTLVVTDILAQAPGLTVSRTGGPGQTTSLYIRGAEPGESLVLIDGVRINDPSTPDGEPVLGDLLANDIARIEVLRGPQSTLYGSDAIGGVVNILTQRGGPDAFAPRIEGQGGTYGTSQLNAALNGTAGPLEYGSAINYYNTRGISVADTSNVDFEPDGDRNVGATANLRLHLGDQFSLDLRGFYLRSRTDIADYPPPDYTLSATEEFVRDSLLAGYAALNAAFFEGHLTQRLALIGSDSDRRFYGLYTPTSNPDVYLFSPGENFYAQGGATRLEYQGVIEANAANELTYGAETELSTLTTDSLPDPANMPVTGRDRLSGYYGQWQSTLAKQLTLTGGVRYDDDQQFGGHTSGKLAAAWQLFEGATVLRANYGNGFKAPTLYQQFSPYSNPLQTLAPETAVGWEAGADQLLLEQQLRASLTYFDRHEHNEIDFNGCFPAVGIACAERPGGYYYNVGRTSARGIEAELVARPHGPLSAWVNYTNLTAIDELTGLELARRPHISANAGLAWTVRANTSLGASLSYVGSRYDDDANTVPLSSNNTIDVFGSYALSARLQLFARVDNLFDNRSETVAGYRVLGQAFYAGVRATL